MGKTISEAIKWARVKKSKNVNWDTDPLTKAIGKIKLTVTDASENHDKYLYGREKVYTKAERKKRIAIAKRLARMNLPVSSWEEMEKEIEKGYLEGLDKATIKDILKKNGKI